MPMVTRMLAKPRSAESGSVDPGAGDLLVLVGERVRILRSRLNMTRKSLAQASSVSERYLAQLEQGQGNISIVRLQQIAEALGTDLSELVSSENDRTAEQGLINELVVRMIPVERQRAWELLQNYFSVLHGQYSRVALLGMRGAGKTTLGKLLADHHGVPFVRLVGETERLAGLNVSEILSLSGQNAYRRFEEQALLESLQQHECCVIETGGGIVAEEGTFNTLLRNCFVVWLQARPEEHMQRVIEQGDLRPMRSNKNAMAELRRILRERAPYYAKAHATLDTSRRSVEECLRELIELAPLTIEQEPANG